MKTDRPDPLSTPPAARCGSEARLRVLRALHRLDGSAAYGALLSTAGVGNRELDDALKGLAHDRWVLLDRSVARAMGGLWRMSRDRRRAVVLMEEQST